MVNAKYFDVYDKDITPEIYTLLFAGIIAEVKGNDLVYDISHWLDPDHFKELKEEEEDGGANYFVEDWEDRIKRGCNNGFKDKKAMKKFIANPCSVFQAIEKFLEWLKEKGAKEGDALLVKIWW